MWRAATATGSSANCTWIWRRTYSLGLSGSGHFALMLNSRPMDGWSFGARLSSQKPSHQSGSWPVPVRHALSIEPRYDTSQPALNSIRLKCRFGNRSQTPPLTRSAMIRCGLADAGVAAAHVERFDTMRRSKRVLAHVDRVHQCP